jgi:cytochrome c oxidase assembly protein subunit 15
MFEKKENNAATKTEGLLKVILGFVILQLIYGAFTAGLHAGRVANTFPMMDGEWIPTGINVMSPGYMNLFENLLTVQFIHRMLAYTIAIMIFYLWWTSRKEDLSRHQKKAIQVCLFAVSVQFLLGVFTLLYHTPVTLAALHQTGGFFLFTSVITTLFFFSKPKLVAQ